MMDVKVENLPRALQAHPYFCVWKWATRDGKRTKPPFNPRNTQRGAKVNDLSTFAPLLVAKDAAERDPRVAGIGFAVADGVAGIDIDHCITEGKLSPEAQEIVNTMDAYTEKSPSGDGVHIYFRAPGFSYDKSVYAIKRGNLEIYIAGMTNRYLTVTGNVLDGHGGDLVDRADRLPWILDKYMKNPQGGETPVAAPAAAPVPAPAPAPAPDDAPSPVDINEAELDEIVRNMPDADLIAKAKTAKNGRGEAFSRLWAGYWEGAYSSQSNADQALCNSLGFWTRCDADRMDRLFRQSGLIRDKWDEKRPAGTYGSGTINEAIEWCKAHNRLYTPSRRGTAAADQGAGIPAGKKSKDRLSIDGLKTWMALNGWLVRFNVITKENEFVGKTGSGYSVTMDTMVTCAHDSLVDKYKGVNFDTLTRYAAFIASENRFNPVLEMLSAAKWDGCDRLPQVYAVLEIGQDELSKVLVRKWLYQTVALLFNDESKPFGADGCLVLKGEQGKGKSSFFAHLALRNEWFDAGFIDDRDKDTSRRLVTKWICELSEVESTLKSDISKLKAFVTAAVDRYRLPYGHADIVSPRMTSLGATANNDRYLIDPTGNRRWWSVPFPGTERYDEIVQIDALQLWAQIYADIAPMSYDQKAACFRLTPDEQNALSARNRNFEKPVKGELEVLDVLSKAATEKLAFKRMTVGDFIKLWPELRLYSVQQIGIALSRCGIDQNRDAKGDRYRMLPTPYERA